MAAVIGLLMLCGAVDADAQFGTGDARYGIWYMPSSLDVYGIAVGPFFGIWPRMHDTQMERERVNGLALEFIGSGILTLVMPYDPVHPTGEYSIEWVVNKARNHPGVNGITVSATGTLGLSFVNGISIGGLGGWATEINGMAVHGVVNFSNHVNGLCVALYNDLRDANGLQIGLRNRAERTAGLQIGGFNRSERLSGVQIGLFNECYGSLGGVQIGLVNIGPGGWMPVLNARF